jgi:hypothetical protein
MKKTVDKAGMTNVLMGIAGGFAAQFLQNKLTEKMPKIASYTGAGVGLILVLSGMAKKPIINALAVGMAGQTGGNLIEVLKIGVTGPGDFSDSDLGLNAAEDDMIFLNAPDDFEAMSANDDFEALNAAADFSASVSAAADFAASVSGSYESRDNQLF